MACFGALLEDIPRIRYAHIAQDKRQQQTGSKVWKDEFTTERIGDVLSTNHVLSSTKNAIW